MRGVERIDWRLADDDVWDMLADLEADIAAGKAVDEEEHALLKLAAEEIDEDLRPETLEPGAEPF